MNTSTKATFASANPNVKSKDWYNRVYLCYEDTNITTLNVCGPIKGFNCYRYNSFENADNAFQKNENNRGIIDFRHTMIPICKWVPVIFDKYILNWKLLNMYWKGQHSFGCGYNRYK